MSKDIQRSVLRHSKDRHEEPPMKKDITDPKYSKQALEYLLRLRADNPRMSQTKLGVAMMKAGWYGQNLRQLTQGEVSRFMVAHGHKAHEKNAGPKGKQIGGSGPVLMDRKNASPLERQLIQILNAQLDPDVLAAAVTALARKHTQE